MIVTSTGMAFDLTQRELGDRGWIRLFRLFRTAQQAGGLDRKGACVHPAPVVEQCASSSREKQQTANDDGCWLLAAPLTRSPFSHNFPFADVRQVLPLQLPPSRVAWKVRCCGFGAAL